jgi:hypothetical protein
MARTSYMAGRGRGPGEAAMLGYGKAVVVGWDHRLGIMHCELLGGHYESVARGPSRRVRLCLRWGTCGCLTCVAAYIMMPK